MIGVTFIVVSKGIDNELQIRIETVFVLLTVYALGKATNPSVHPFSFG